MTPVQDPVRHPDAENGILVVDDNPDNLRLIVNVLQQAGLGVRVAPGGRLALESVVERRPALILLDIRMPDLDGFEVCRRLKEDPATADIPVIFLSALREPEDKLQGFAAGAVDYITKPFVAEEVLVRVKSHLALHESHRELEALVAERTRALHTVSAGNRALVHAESEVGLLQGMTDAIVTSGDYPAAGVWMEDGRHCQSGSPAAAVETGTLNPAGPCLVRFQDPRLLVLVLPLQSDRGMLGSLQVSSHTQTAFAATEDIALLAELAGDLVYGLRTQQSRTALEHSLERTIEAMAATIEVRDPYTAGHQQRTTRIADAIAAELGLDPERRKGLHVASSIHDIGKISVPVEILAKPGRLSEPEFELIKGHAELGYEILKGIDFPWPVATIVRQHHERRDGSGYPDGLRGDAILLESQILAVADVVEAIHSHRPYRPGLGLEVALAELQENRGRLYAPQVVDACLRLAAEDRLPL
ncbi:Response regulator containing a CheY-like receiver domain and an HD-GYP domain [Thioalkalivibrio nitratireducens DSM 14787]|uniref:Response regulator containing a CheY-like receiver domain and an HD-GYP domain n=1 Tax=Thioalkalivibrio nitratireducens (strain DSM 14787 / UNIQEM 213 / ALEN2) TaxID=1255043 RepID=L0DU82_THIND|nr:HD domain-containing phosphohydrolase [Thioalkalivibrio nitratireducens]AGA31886.1 Response regulator containing a CheY-like receiver domain and an HD-GYP domain [Thioalkalivibrio nitratireducens DSM 14787]